MFYSHAFFTVVYGFFHSIRDISWLFSMVIRSILKTFFRSTFRNSTSRRVYHILIGLIYKLQKKAYIDHFAVYVLCVRLKDNAPVWRCFLSISNDAYLGLYSSRDGWQ